MRTKALFKRKATAEIFQIAVMVLFLVLFIGGHWAIENFNLNHPVANVLFQIGRFVSLVLLLLCPYTQGLRSEEHEGEGIFVKNFTRERFKNNLKDLKKTLKNSFILGLKIGTILILLSLLARVVALTFFDTILIGGGI